MRRSNISADFDYEGRSPQGTDAYGEQIGGKIRDCAGSDELARGDVKIKIMETSEEISLKQSEAIKWFLNRQSPQG